LVTDEVPRMVSNHVEDRGSASVPYSDVSSQRQNTPKRSLTHSNSVSSSNVVEGNPHSVVHVEDTISAFSRTESFPVSGMLQTESEKIVYRPYLPVCDLVSADWQTCIIQCMKLSVKTITEFSFSDILTHSIVHLVTSGFVRHR